MSSSETFEQTYRRLFRRHYTGLLFYAARLVGEDEAEDVVQDVFAELWRRQDAVELGGQIQSFLYRAVYTRALNVLKHRDVVGEYEAEQAEIHRRRMDFYSPDHNEVIRRIEDSELRRQLADAIRALPDKCRTVFVLSYLHDMKNREIAEALGISTRTVEAHMYKALHLLRERLGVLRLLAVLFFMGKLSIFAGHAVI